MTIYAWDRVNIADEFPRQTTRWLAERLIEEVNENYGGEDSCDGPSEETIVEALLPKVKELIDQFIPWRCEPTGQQRVYQPAEVEAILRETYPEMLNQDGERVFSLVQG